jgi:hypothetical protein
VCGKIRSNGRGCVQFSDLGWIQYRGGCKLLQVACGGGCGVWAGFTSRTGGGRRSFALSIVFKKKSGRNSTKGVLSYHSSRNGRSVSENEGKIQEIFEKFQFVIVS